jgi:hypothetical protein
MREAETADLLGATTQPKKPLAPPRRSTKF